MASISDSERLGMLGLVVHRCCVDFALTLDLAAGSRQGSIVVRGACTLVVDAVQTQFDDATARTELAPAFGLLGSTVTAIDILEGGSLLVRFSSGAQLQAWADERYESWEVFFPDHVQVICLPGGELAVFPTS